MNTMNKIENAEMWKQLFASTHGTSNICVINIQVERRVFIYIYIYMYNELTYKVHWLVGEHTKPMLILLIEYLHLCMESCENTITLKTLI